MSGVLKNTVLLFSLMGTFNLLMGQNFRIADIPDSLKKNAHAVLRFDSTNIAINNIHNYTYSEERVISVLDASLERLLLQALPYNDREEIKNYKAWLYDQDGNLIQRTENTDVVDMTSNFGSLISNERLKVLNIKKVKAPFTVKVIFTKQVNETAFMPRWLPATEYDESIECAKLIINYPDNFGLKTDAHIITAHVESGQGITCEIDGFKPVEKEDYGPRKMELLPWLDIMPEKFELYGIEGSSTSWNDVGIFMNNLDNGKDILKHISDHDLNKILEENESDRTKTADLFRYLQRNFHYANVELGIGGWQAAEASVTLQKKYGDCKALAFVLKALLKKAGIPSWCTLVYAGEERSTFSPDFPDLNFNHVMLCVPLHGDSVWLECTSPIVAFNSVYKAMANRKALLIFDGGARLINTPLHTETYNSSNSITHIILNDNNTCIINAVVSRKGDLQDTIRYAVNQNNQKLIEAIIYDAMHFKNTTISSCSIKQVEADSPVVVIALGLSNENTIRKTDQRVFIKTDIFSPIANIPGTKENRVEPVVIDNGYTQTDTLIYNLPLDYLPENFKPGEIKTLIDTFGYADCEVRYVASSGVLTIIRNFCLKTAVYDKSRYQDFRSFLQKALKISTPDLVLRKKQ